MSHAIEFRILELLQKTQLTVVISYTHEIEYTLLYENQLYPLDLQAGTLGNHSTDVLLIKDSYEQLDPVRKLLLANEIKWHEMPLSN